MGNIDGVTVVNQYHQVFLKFNFINIFLLLMGAAFIILGIFAIILCIREKEFKEIKWGLACIILSLLYFAYPIGIDRKDVHVYEIAVSNSQVLEEIKNDNKYDFRGQKGNHYIIYIEESEEVHKNG